MVISLENILWYLLLRRLIRGDIDLSIEEANNQAV